jgi:hypothetical protein
MIDCHYKGVKIFKDLHMEWKTAGRPGQFGRRRDEAFRRYDAEYGAGKWRLAWRWGSDYLSFPEACEIYEQAYMEDSHMREGLWKRLVGEASGVYDIDPSDFQNRDYSSQPGASTQLQHIAINRVVDARGWRFEGGKLVQIRGHGSHWGRSLSPGKVAFHRPEMIVVPHLKGWWDDGSVECWYQSAKELQVLGAGVDVTSVSSPSA